MEDKTSPGENVIDRARSKLIKAFWCSVGNQLARDGTPSFASFIDWHARRPNQPGFAIVNVTTHELLRHLAQELREMAVTIDDMILVAEDRQMVPLAKWDDYMAEQTDVLYCITALMLGWPHSEGSYLRDTRDGIKTKLRAGSAAKQVKYGN